MDVRKKKKNFRAIYLVFCFCKSVVYVLGFEFLRSTKRERGLGSSSVY